MFELHQGPASKERRHWNLEIVFQQTFRLDNRIRLLFGGGRHIEIKNKTNLLLINLF